ncbi:hypothetical protein CAJAP_00849 [Camponotus japonicus]
MDQTLLRHFELEKNKSDDSEDSDEFHDISELLITGDAENAGLEDLILPPHQRCASHTLNLIADKDSEKALHSDVQYKKIYRTTFAKLSYKISRINRPKLLIKLKKCAVST